MGWTSGWPSRAELIRHLTVDQEPSLRTGAHCTVSNTLWAVQSNPHHQGGTPFIACYLIRRYARDDWGYKDMDESMGPCECSCPEKYLAMAPEPKSEFAKGWRDRV